MRFAILALFVLTYVGISARRLRLFPIGRPAVALVGASLAVAVGTFAGEHGLSIDEALRAVEPHTVALLFGMMVVAAALDVAGFFAVAAQWLARRELPPTSLLAAVTVGCGLLAAVLVNDAVCLLATPLIVRMVVAARLPVRPFLFAICMGANAGSAMTFSGNPQNMLVAQLSKVSYRDYLATAAVPALLALAVTAATLVVVFRTSLAWDKRREESPPEVELDRPLLTVALVAVVLIVAANLLGAPLALSALVAASICLLASKSRAEALLQRVDWSVLLFFAGLFILVAALQKTGFVREAIAAVGAPTIPAILGAICLGSQVVSNVPLILLVEPMIHASEEPAVAWMLTAFVSTLAGNLTLLGSVANIIVVERGLTELTAAGESSRDARIGFFSYLPVGALVTSLSLIVGLTWMWLVR